MKKKKIIIVIAVILLILCLVPKVSIRNDGGTREYNAIFYSVTKYHIMNENNDYAEGWKIKILGITIYDKVNTNQ